MRNRYRFILGCVFLFHLSFPNEIHQSIRIFEPTVETINVIGSLGIPLDHITGKPGVFIDLTVKDDATIELLSRGIDLEILVPDLTLHYRARNRATIPRDFPLGSMQGNYTWDELNTRFDE